MFQKPSLVKNLLNTKLKEKFVQADFKSNLLYHNSLSNSLRLLHNSSNDL